MNQYDWDFFVAHAAADTELAELLFAFLQPHCRVFLDSKTLRPGDLWDERLSAAQRASRATIVIISSHSEQAHYELAEIVAAIQMSRDTQGGHKVIPVIVGVISPPYGLQRFQAIRVPGTGSIAEAATAILDLFRISAPNTNALPIATQVSVSRHWGLIEGETIEVTFTLRNQHSVRYHRRPSFLTYSVILTVDEKEIWRQRFGALTEGTANIQRVFVLDGVTGTFIFARGLTTRVSLTVGEAELYCIPPPTRNGT